MRPQARFALAALFTLAFTGGCVVIDYENLFDDDGGAPVAPPEHDAGPEDAAPPLMCPGPSVKDAGGILLPVTCFPMVWVKGFDYTFDSCFSGGGESWVCPEGSTMPPQCAGPGAWGTSKVNIYKFKPWCCTPPEQ